MKQYIGVKVIKARPMTMMEFNTYAYPDNPRAGSNAEGYLVEYEQDPESPNKNHTDHDGYISWSPKNVFEKAYKQTDGLTFGLALEALKAGKKIWKKSWEGSLDYIDPNNLPTPEILVQKVTGRFSLEISEDILAEDWYILD